MLDIVNRYAHGFVGVPVVQACLEHNLFDLLEQDGALDGDEIGSRLGANAGHLAVALRLLVSLGWLRCDPANRFELTPAAQERSCIPSAVVSLLNVDFGAYLASGAGREHVRRWIDASCRRWGIDAPRLADMLDGMLAVPLLSTLAGQHLISLDATGRLDWRAHVPRVVQSDVLELFLARGWATGSEGAARITGAGQYLLERGMVLGTTASYSAMLARLPDLVFGDARGVVQRTTTGHETHVDRTLNVVASGVQHEHFFGDVARLVGEIFERLPLDEQPDYVVDVGCGDGTLLRRLYATIGTSARGQVLDRKPVVMVGVDASDDALAVAGQTLAGIPHLLLHGDVSAPAAVVDQLRERGVDDPQACLHVRSFLDHERQFSLPQNDDSWPADRVSGVQVDEDGRLISNLTIARTLTDHFRRWAPVLARHGLIVLEVHSLDSAEVTRYFDETESFHFDAYHGFSGQHLVAADTFLIAAARAGLFPDRSVALAYPRTMPVTRISLNHLRLHDYSVRFAAESDLPTLVQIEAAILPAPLQASEDELRARIVQHPGNQFVLELDRQVVAVSYARPVADSNGSAIELLGLLVHPEFQHLGLGEVLLAFVLQLASVTRSVERVVGVSRPRNYPRFPNLSMAEYVRLRTPDGDLVDPVLRFHASLGATIGEPVPDHRPADLDNHGFGVRIHYDVREGGQTREEADPQQRAPASTERASRSAVVEAAVRRLLRGRVPAVFSPHIALRDLGLDSLDLLELRTTLARHFQRQFEPTVFFDYPTIDAVTDLLVGDEPAPVAAPRAIAPSPAPVLAAESMVMPSTPSDDIAIVALACRLPGAPGVEDLWALLAEGRDAIADVPADEDRKQLAGIAGIARGGFLTGVDQFDAAHFRIAPREADQIDPQQRLLLEVTWEAFERAGIAPDRLDGARVGVFVGLCGHDYELLQVRSQPVEQTDRYFATGSAGSVAAGRVAYFYGLRGPTMSIDTACSSSLVAVHLARRSLLDGECEQALVAGVNLVLAPEACIAYERAGMLSHDGRCKTFDAAADGFVRGEGCVAAVLKPLSRAIADNDPIVAVLRGSAINHDGASNGLTAPHAVAQEMVIRSALESASVSADSVTYVEAHGSGTPLGDPIEMKALAATYGAQRGDADQLLVGSIKTNIGHTEGASGLAGLAKAALALERRAIPPHLNTRRLNPAICAADGSALPVRLPATLEQWPRRGDNPLRAGVSAFGFSGTNAHVILEQAPPRARVESSNRPDLFVLSGRSESALATLVGRYRQHLESGGAGGASLAEIAHTSRAGRARFEHRLAVVCDEPDALLDTLRDIERGAPSGAVSGSTSWLGRAPEYATPVAFAFSGQGEQFPQMGRELFDQEPAFRAAIDRVDTDVRAIAGWSVIDVMYGGESALVHRTDRTQPLLFGLQYALLELWASRGIRPAAVLGHSLGEIAAAHAAGVLKFEDAVRLSVTRGRLMHALPPGGAMVAVVAPEERVERAVADSAGAVAVAARNGPSQLVIAGPAAAVAGVAAQLTAQGFRAVQIGVSMASHCALVEPILDQLTAVASAMTFQPARIPMASTVTGSQLDRIDANYWGRNVRQPVLFSAAVRSLRERGFGVFLELGPAATLAKLGPHCLPDDAAVWIASQRKDTGGRRALVEASAQLFVEGAALDYTPQPPPRRVALPTYPFERKRHWLAAPADAQPQSTVERSGTLLGQKLDSPLDVVQYEARLGQHSPAYLADHRVHGTVVMPATGFLTMALEAATQRLGNQPIALLDVVMPTALELVEGTLRSVQTVLRGDPRGGAVNVEIHSKPVDGSWRCHFRAEARLDPSGPRLDLRAADAWQTIDAEQFYAGLRARHLDYGPTFRRVTGVCFRPGLAECSVATERSQAGDAGPVADPAVLDACLQAVYAAIPEGTWMPVNAASVRVFGDSTSALHSIVRIREDRTAAAFTADFQVTDSRAQIVAEIVGMVFTSVRPDVLRHALQPAQTMPDSLYRVEWRDSVLRDPEARSAGRRWLLVGGDSLGHELVARLRERGSEVTLGGEPTGPDGFAALLAAWGRLDGRPGGIVHLPSGTAGERRALGTTVAALDLIRAAMAADGTRIPLWFVTRGAVAADESPGPPDATEATLWGLGRVAALEYPDRWGGLIDLAPSADSGDAYRLARELESDSGEDQVAWRGDRRFVARLVRAQMSRVARDPVVRADGVYLVTGGRGFLGRHVARWLARRGAARVVLLGRRANAESAEPLINELEALGTRVTLCPADVADEHVVRRTLTALAQSGEQLRGIVHAAGIASFQSLQHENAVGIERVFRAKVDGSRNLHLASRRLELDFFVCFSSASSVWGAAQHAAYAAANSYMDALVRHRRACGLPGLSVNWALVGTGGMLPEGYDRQLARIGVNALPIDDAMATLETLIAHQVDEAVVAAVDWSRFTLAYEALRARPFLAEIDRGAERRAADHNHMPIDDGKEVLRLFETTAGEAHSRVVEDYLRSAVAKALQLDLQRVDVRRSLNRMGLDSLMAIELRTRVERDLGVRLPIARLMEGVSVAELARLVEASSGSLEERSPAVAAEWIEGEV